MKLISIFCTLWAISFSLYSQTIVSPEVLPEGEVIFRFFAPNAKQAMVHMEKDSFFMQKDSSEIWSVTTPKLTPNIYSYKFVIDGISMIDPGNRSLKNNLFNTSSLLIVENSHTSIWSNKNVTHGQIHQHFYHSDIIGDERDYYVYTPPSYNPKENKKYPVLYLLHGYSDDASVWITTGRVNFILDNLIAQKLAQPMIVVMPYGYGNLKLTKQKVSSSKDTALWMDSYRKFRESLFNEIIPQIEAQYNAHKDAASRAIAGLSMGGSQSLLFGLNSPEKFNWIGAFSAGGINDFDRYYKVDSMRINSQVKYLWIGCGQKDGGYQRNKDLTKWLGSKNIKCEWGELPGAHNYLVWRPFLEGFVIKLFR